MRPIDADALIQFFQSSKNQKAFYTYFTTTDIIRVLENAPTLALDDLGIVRCNDCVWFDDEGYENYDPEMPELRMGFCRIWRRDTQACRFCSMGGGE